MALYSSLVWQATKFYLIFNPRPPTTNASTSDKTRRQSYELLPLPSRNVRFYPTVFLGSRNRVDETGALERQNLIHVSCT